MQNKFIITVLLILLTHFLNAQKPEYVIIIHGGAGDLTKEYLTSYDELSYKTALNEALEIGSEILENGGSAVDAVVKVISVLEDSPVFNAGKGAVFNTEGINELEAAIMDGKNMHAGAVACVTDIKNPIMAAYEVMTKSKHILLVGQGASDFAKKRGLKIVDNSYFFTFQRWTDYQKYRERKLNRERQLKNIKGTVGCVVLDKYGNLAAGTSTGGSTNKAPGRVGDTPIIGAGTYANNDFCAISCAGEGEYFLKYSVAHDIVALMEYKNYSLDQAANYIINTKLKKIGGDGGIIAIDKNGNISMQFNTNGMFRAYKNSFNKKEILIFK